MNRIQEIFANDKKAITEFFKIFIVTTTELIHKLQIAIKEKNMMEAKSLIHRIKGSSANAGFMRVNQISELTEKNLIEENWQSAGKNSSELENELQDLNKFVNEEWSSSSE